MDSHEIRDFGIEYADLPSYYQGAWFPNYVWMGWVENLKVYFIEPHHPRYFFNRGCIYGCEDDVERYLYFCRCAMELLYKKQINPDIIHLHDWQSAAIAPLYYELYKPMGYNKPKIAFTIHNIEYQGLCSTTDLDWIGLDGKKLNNPHKLQDNHNHHNLNLLKGGIVYSDAVTTVSPSYAKEVLTPLGGRGLDTTLVKHKDKFTGILNGIDYSYWNPEIDRYLPNHFSPREIPANKKDYHTLDKKAYVKKVLRDKLNLGEVHRPIIGCISRLVPQKGLEIIKHTMLAAIEKGSQFVLLGSSPIPSINAEFHDLKHQFADHPHISLTLHYQEDLAHLIFAGSDIIIVPSIFEPCGLTQMIALKYGTIPIVRRTGGLADTIFDVDNSGKEFDETNGYTFDSPDAEGMYSALNRALHCWFEQPDKWRKLVVNGMNIDFSWNKSSDKYLEIYKKIKP